jgi:urease accessory protein
MKGAFLMIILKLSPVPTLAMGSFAGFAAGFDHPMTGIDHVTTMIVTRPWAGLNSGSALWARGRRPLS